MSAIGQNLESYIDINKYQTTVGQRKDRPANLSDFSTFVRLCLIDYQQENNKTSLNK